VDLGEDDPNEMGYEKINKEIYNTTPMNLQKLMEYKLFRV
jgi:hypothetical protein